MKDDRKNKNARNAVTKTIQQLAKQAERLQQLYAEGLWHSTERSNLLSDMIDVVEELIQSIEDSLLKNSGPHEFNLDEELASKFLGVSVAYLRRARYGNGQKVKTPGPSFARIGGKVRYSRADLETWVANLPNG